MRPRAPARQGWLCIQECPRIPCALANMSARASHTPKPPAGIDAGGRPLHVWRRLGPSSPCCSTLVAQLDKTSRIPEVLSSYATVFVWQRSTRLAPQPLKRFRLAAFDPFGLDDPDPSSPGGLMPVRPTAPARFARRLQAGASLCSRILVHQWLIGFPRSDELQPQIVLSPLERGVGVEANPKVPGDSVQCAMKRELI